MDLVNIVCNTILGDEIRMENSRRRHTNPRQMRELAVTCKHRGLELLGFWFSRAANEIEELEKEIGQLKKKGEE